MLKLGMALAKASELKTLRLRHFTSQAMANADGTWLIALP